MDDKTTINNKYKRSLGLLELVAFGLGGTIGSGIFIVPAIASSIAGPSSILAWIIASASASAVMYSLAKTSSKYPSTGAFYSIFSKVFNKRTSFLLVLTYLIACIFAISAIVSGVGQYVLSIISNNSNTNNDLNNNIINNDHNQFLIVFIIEIITIVVFCLINIKGVSISGKAENILTITKVAPLIILIIILIPHIRESNFYPFFHSYFTNASAKSISTSNVGFLKALVVIYFPFAGFEICAIPAEETKGEQKTAYRSMKIVMIIVIFIYIFLNVSLIGSLGSKVLANSPAPLATASELILKQSSFIVSILGIVAMLSAINAYVFASSRVLQNISSLFKNNYLGILKRIGSSGTPKGAIIIITVISVVLLILFSSSFETLADISVIMTLIPYSFVCLSAYKLYPHNKVTKIISASGVISTVAIVAIYFIFQIL